MHFWLTSDQVVGIYQRKFAFQQAREAARDGSTVEDVLEPTDEEVLGDWMISLIKTMRADMDNDKLYPPGTVYIMVGHPLKTITFLLRRPALLKIV